MHSGELLELPLVCCGLLCSFALAYCLLNCLLACFIGVLPSLDRFLACFECCLLPAGILLKFNLFPTINECCLPASLLALLLAFL